MRSANSISTTTPTRKCGCAFCLESKRDPTCRGHGSSSPLRIMKMPDVKRKRFVMRNLRRLLLIGLLAVAGAPVVACVGPGPGNGGPPQFLLRATPDNAPIVAARHGLSIVGQVNDGSGVIMFLAVPAMDTPGLSQDFNADTEITAFEEN